MRRTLAAFAFAMLASSAGGAELDVLALDLGAEREAIERLLAEASLEPLRASDREILLDVTIVPGVFERQVTRLRFDDEARLLSIAVRIEPAPHRDGRDVLQIHQTVRNHLLRRLGRPAWEDAEGSDASSDVLRQLASGEVVRVIEWHGERRAIRAGIPRRIDGRTNIEIAVTAEPLPRFERSWGSSGR
ncbi:MAG TPA: hypothetical protein VLV48_07160 [Thermoanaerobaculia bacterium]|nr:hypothetical protein [Thermoanaerobaculia bacterium]